MSAAKKPTWSSEADRGITPWREMRSRLGLKPKTPQNPAGRTIEPMVWVPSARGASPAATAAADPLLDPPGVWPRLCGLRVGPGAK